MRVWKGPRMTGLTMKVLLPLLVFVWICPETEAQAQTFLVVAPRSFRLDATEKVVVQLFGFTEPVNVYVFLKKTMADMHMVQQMVTLTAQNQHQGEVHLRLLPENVNDKMNQVVLHVISDAINHHVLVPISRSNGFMFIQTDKPLYTPQQNVKVRVFSLNQELRPADRSVFLTFRDPDREKVDVVEVKDVSNGMPSLQNPFRIPINPKLGIWTIEASYMDHFDTVAKTDFEVREYVLPSFTILIQPRHNYISFNNFNMFSFKVSAKYLHGAPVAGGELFLRYGFVSPNSSPVIVPSSVTRQRLSTTGEIAMNVNLEKAFSHYSGPKTLQDLLDKYLYMTVLLREDTGGISQEAELNSVKFVKSPYRLGLVSTPPFIKPGLPYYIQVLVKDHLNEPVRGVPVSLVESHLHRSGRDMQNLSCFNPISSGDDGIAQFVCNIKIESLRLDLRFVTADQSLPAESQASLSLGATSYDSPNARYLYIDPSPIKDKVGHYTQVTIHTVGPPYLSVKTLNYLIISKGRVIKYDRVNFDPRSEHRHTLRFQITSDMVPSIRLLVFYMPYGESTTELVADSVWFNIQGDCVNGIQTELNTDSMQYKPQQPLQINVRANQAGLVALSAVDTGIYSLRPNYMDPVSKVLRHIEKSDLGCGGGGGKNAADVFRLAGLSFMTNAVAGHSSSDAPCDAVVRPKRALSAEERERKLSDYKPVHLRKCCNQGMMFSPTFMTCAAFANMSYAKFPKCEKAFRECCIYIQQSLDRDYVLGRAEMGGDFNKAPTLVRSSFPESWLWEVKAINREPLQLSRKLPDSLTTWHIRAVGMFDSGICVAKSRKVSVNLPLSVDVPLPYQIVRGEQIQLKGSVYNQLSDTVRFCVTLTVGPELCLVNSQTDRANMRTTPCKMRALSGDGVGEVQFTLMALKEGKHQLTFHLKTPDHSGDTVRKTLTVVPEGVLEEVMRGGRLDPQGLYGSQKHKVELKSFVPQNIVPNTPIKRMLTINGEILDEFVSVVDNPEGLRTLLDLQDGSAASELGGVLPVLHVYQYLDTTGRWHILGPDDQKNSGKLKDRIKEGLVSVSSFRKGDYSYSMWMNRESSTWVTALAVQTLAMVNQIVSVDHESLARSVNWLVLNTQRPDGAFTDTSNYKPNRIMQSDSLEKSVYLTSFVLIALLKATRIPTKELELQSQENSIQSAIQYISQNTDAVKKVYVLSVAAYALTLHDSESISSNRLVDRLETLSKQKGNPPVLRYWQEAEVKTDWLKPDETSGQTVETTAYALLTFLLKGRFQDSKPIVSWLTQDQHYGGGHLTLQDTLMALEAVTLYSYRVPKTELDQEINIRFNRESELNTEVHLTRRAPVASPIQITKNSNAVVSTAFSKGVSHVKLKTVYYQTVPPQKNCYFDITLEMLKFGSSDRSLSAPHLVACAKYKPPPDENVSESMLTVMEIQLPSGVEPFLDDLRPLRDGEDPLIANFKLNGRTVVVHVNSIPSDRFLCVGFRIRTAFTVGGTSDTVFTVYEDQDKGTKCTKQVSDQEQKIHRLCQFNQCQCVTAVCSLFRGTVEPSLTVQTRMREICSPQVKYAFKVKVTSSSSEGDFVIYTASVVEVVKNSNEFEAVGGGTEIDFVKKTTCNAVDVKKNQQYLISGSSGLEVVQDKNFRFRFPLDSDVTVEVWPTDCGPECAELVRFSWLLQLNGC